MLRHALLARPLLLLATAVSAAAVSAAPGDIPLVAVGLPFAPVTPQPLGPDDPLFRTVVVSEIAGLPAVVGGSRLNWIGAARRSSINEGLRETFRRMNMLAPADGAARARLTATWVGERTPFRIATRNSASVTLHGRLARTDTGEVLFDHDVTTSASGGGVDAAMRDTGIVRAAIAANFVSVADCLDRATRGPTPDACALTPRFSVSVVRQR